MSRREDWMPYSLAEKMTMFQNVRGKIGQYEAVLPITAAQRTRVEEICDSFIYAFSVVEQSRATMKALVAWRDEILSNRRSSRPVPERPMFDNALPPASISLGIYAEFRSLMEIVKASPGYTAAIGDDLSISPPRHAPRSLAEIAPSPKVTAVGEYGVRIAGSLEGMDAMRVEYQPRSEDKWRPVAFLTSLPETIRIDPAVPGEPESGGIRCILLKKNKEVGQYSPIIRVTISPD